MRKRSVKYKKYWTQLIETHGAMCFYCNVRVATTIDHIVPVSFYEDDSIDNLVPACPLCNSVASNKVFDNVWDKRAYVLSKVGKRNRIAECTDCLILFEYRINSPSLFLCPICYDIEYGTRYSKKVEWNRWVNLLSRADFVPSAHDAIRELSAGKRYSKNALRALLVDEILKYWTNLDKQSKQVIESKILYVS